MLKLRVGEVAEQQGWTKSGLQRASGVTMPTLIKYWNNSVESIHLPSFEKIARALKVPAASLLNEVKDEIESTRKENTKAGA
jgi:transcriptional regulator with XRE-family HTH domain